MSKFGFSDDILAEIKQLRDLEEKQNSQEGKDEAAAELSRLNLYKVAANSTEDRDPAQMGEIEQLLRSGNTEGLKARLGEQTANQLQDLYLESWQQVEADRNVPRTAGETLQDVVVGVPSSIVNTIWGAEMLAGGLASPDYMAISAEANRNFNQNTVDPLLSDGLKSSRRLKEALDSQAEEEHLKQAEEELGPRSTPLASDPEAWFVHGKRLARDFGTGIANTASDPTLLLQGTAEAVASMGSAAVLKKGLEATGKAVIKNQVTKLLAREAKGEVTETLLGKLGEATIRGLNKNLGALSWAGANAALEGTGAYQQAVTDVLLASPDDLMDTSEDFRALKAQGLSDQEAQAQLAHKTGLMAAGMTGVAAAGISHLLGAPGIEPTRVVTGSLLKDALEEGVEEGLQGASGALIGNASKKAFVDPNQDLLAGVGLQAGEGGILGAASAGGLKAPGAALGAPQMAGSALAQVGKFASKMGDKKLAAAEAESQASLQSLSQRSVALADDTNKTQQLTAAVQESLGKDYKADVQLRSDLGELVNSPLVLELPGSHAGLSEENQAKFQPEQSRAEAVNTAAELLLAEKDSAKQTDLALFLSDLMEPVRRFRELPTAFQTVSGNTEAMGTIGEYQQLLADIEQLPAVQKATARMGEMIDELDTSDASDPKVAQLVAAYSALDPSLGGKASSEMVEQVLAHKKVELTPSQKAALQGSLAVLKAREVMESGRDPAEMQKLLKQHLEGDRNKETTGRQALVEVNPANMETGKYSARQHTSRIIRAMMSGNTESAQAYLDEFSNFVQHFQNKVGALNNSVQKDGERFSYQQYIGNGKFVDSRQNPKKYKHKDAWVNLKSQGSVQQAHDINNESRLLFQLLKGLKAAYPELQVEMPQQVKLNLTPGKTPAPSKPVAKSEPAAPVEQKPAEQKVTEAVEKALAPEPKVEEKPTPVEDDGFGDFNDTPDGTPVTFEAPVEVKNTQPEGPQPIVEGTLQDKNGKALQVRFDQNTNTTTVSEDSKVLGTMELSRPEWTKDKTPGSEGKWSVNNIEVSTKGRGIGPAMYFWMREQLGDKFHFAEGQTKVEGSKMWEAIRKREEQAKAQPAEDAPAPAPEVKAPAPKTVAELFPNLVQVGKSLRNFFAKGFRLKPDSTRLLGNANPIVTVRDAISADKVKDFLGKDPRGNVTPEIRQAYHGFLSTSARNVATSLNTRLEAFLDSHWEGGITFRQAILEGRHEVTLMQRGKVINLIEVRDGKLRYNTQLRDTAILAALQWQLSSAQREPTSKPDEIAEELGFSSTEEVPLELLKAMEQGQSLSLAKHTLAGYIRRFWGVQADSKQPMGYGEAISEALAAELLFALEDAGLLNVHREDLKKYPYLDDKRVIDRYIPVNSESPLNAYPELLEEMVVVEPEFASYYGNDAVPVADRQLSKSQVELSSETKQALGNMQKQQFFLNLPLVRGILGLDEDQLIELFGNPLPKDGAVRKSQYNKVHLASLESQNVSLRGAFKELRRLVTEMENLSKGGDLASFGKKYKYAVNSVNRIMMLGAYNPQANKLMREMLLPTWSTLDVSGEKESPHYRYLMLALGQALGQKVHNKSLEENVNWAHDALQKDLVPVLEVLSSWLGSDKPFPYKAYNKALGEVRINSKPVEPSPLVAMALTEMARLRKATAEEKKAFRTPLYLESDGMTNGPFNSMGLLAVDFVRPEDVRNWRRGGLSVGQTARTADQLRKTEQDGADLYKEGMKEAQIEVSRQHGRFDSEPDGKQMKSLANAMFTAMQILLDGEVAKDEKGEWQFERGLGKNPSTVLVYGAGNPGIANKIVHRLTTAYYEKLSAASKVGGTWEDAALEMFPGSKPAEALYKAQQLKKAMDVLSQYTVGYDTKSDSYTFAKVSDKPVSERVEKDFRSFEFSDYELGRMQENMLSLFVNPMKEGIRKVLGLSVFAAGDLLVKATQLQSTLAREIYLDAINEKIAEKIAARSQELQKQGLKKNEADRKADSQVKSEFLSREELDQVWKDLKNVMPMVESDGQRFLIAQTALLKFWNEARTKQRPLFQNSRSLDDKKETSPYADGLDGAGVSARPYLTIGMGDARMVRKIFEQAFDNSMQVFDGINIPVDKIAEYGSRINQAALHAWQGNIFQSVSETFERFLADPRVKKARNDQGIINLLKKEKVNLKELDQVQAQLAQAAREQNARVKALRLFALSMDQMAGTYQPFVSEGRDIPEDATDAQIAELINEEIRKELAPKKAPSKASKPAPDDGVQHPSGVSVYTQATMPVFLKWLQGRSSPEEAEVLRELIRSGSLKNLRIVQGTPEQVIRFQETEGLKNSLETLTAQNPTNTIHGYYSISENAIYLMGRDTETAVHELIHAGTLKVVQAYYNGGALKPHVKEAVSRLESLMRLFMQNEHDLDLDFGPGNTAIEDTRAEINNHNPFSPDATPNQKAVALNEFMAWTLSNRALVQELSKENDQFSRLARLTKAAFEALKRLVFGDKKPSQAVDSFMAQVRFNTVLVAREAPSLESLVQNVIVAHATRNGTESSRLSQVMETFGRKVARHLTQSYSKEWLETLGTNAILGDQYRLAAEVTKKAKTVFRDMSEEAVDAFQMMVLAFSTEANINPQSMIEAQRLYDHFLRNLHPDDLLTGKGDPQNDHARAQEKYEFLTEHLKADPSDRSTLLPVFLALATVNDEFRSVLGKKDLPPKHELHGKDKLDTVLEVAGQKVMDLVEDRLTGTDHPENVRVAIDQLMQGLIKSTLEANSSLSDKLGAVGEASYGWNAKVADMLAKLGLAVGRQGDSLRESNSKLVRGAGNVLKAVSFMSSQRNANIIGEGVLAQMDQHPEVGGFFKEVMADMIGRTASQSHVYDMMKRVRKLVSQTRQAYRENVPHIIGTKFKQQPNQSQWNTLYRLMGRFDLASLLETFNIKQTLDLVADHKALKAEITRLEGELQTAHPDQADRYLAKINQYVNFVQTGVRNPNLLRNAYAISELLGEPKDPKWVTPTSDTIQAIDQLITLQLLAQASKAEQTQFTTLLKDEREGLEFVLNYLKGQRKTEMAKAAQGAARFNHYKGLLPSERRGRGHVVVAEDSRSVRMVELGYERLGAYRGSPIENKGASKSYWFSPEGGVKTTYNQGIAQNVQGTAYGVHTETGHSLEATAGRITDPVEVKLLAQKMGRERPGTEALSPVYDINGAVVAFERSLDPKHLQELEQDQNLAKMIGEWKGRQVEESWAAQINAELVEHLYAMWKKDLAEKPSSEDRYINLFDTDSLDPVVRDAVSIFPRELRQLAEERFGTGQFFVRRNMLNMTVGYRNASVGDFWTGTTRHSKETQELVRKAFIAMPGLGLNAYRKLVWAERNWQAAMASVRTNIVVRSLVVPAANFMSGIYQLQVRGVPLLKTLKAVPAKVAEIEFYTKTMARKIELEAERFAHENEVTRTHRIDAQIKSLDDSLKRLSIWPLLEAGEFSTISDVGQTAEDLGTGSNTIVEKLIQAVDKLPPGLRDVARQGYMARDTALFQALQKSVQYSDFVMKAIYFDHLQKVEKKSPASAKAAITEEFNNYDIPPGRNRGYLESMGMAWFLNYKIRSVKIGMSMIRKNPLNLLLYTLVPHPFSGGIPFTDNLITSMMELTLGRALGPGMVFEPISLNPWYNLVAA